MKLRRSSSTRRIAGRYLLGAVVAISWLTGSATRASAQAQVDVDPSENAHYRFGTLAFTPAFVFSSGYDTNVYREPTSFADYETFVVPQIEGWWTLPAFRISAHAAVERVSFLNNVGATNGQVGFRVDRIHSLVHPYFSFDRRRTNAGPTGFEAGYKSLRLENDLVAGLSASITPRSRFEGSATLVRTNWDADARYRTSSLREKLNRDTRRAGAIYSYSVTPLTSIGLSAEVQQDRFKFSPIRDGDSLRLAPVIEFAKPAFVFGTMTLGYEHFRSPASGAADFEGLFAAVSLGYGSPQGTFIRLLINRDVQYSYDTDLAYYVPTSVTLSVARRFAGRWDSAAFAGRYALDYRPRVDPIGARPHEVLTEVGGAVAYRAGQWMRIGVSAEHAQKTGDDAFSALRLITFVTYGSGRFQRLDRPTPFDR